MGCWLVIGMLETYKSVTHFQGYEHMQDALRLTNPPQSYDQASVAR